MSDELNLLSVEGLSKRYGPRVLFEDLTFGLAKGEKVALIARNGAGKTSILDILSGREAPDSGSVTYRKGTSVGFLTQEPEFQKGVTILDALLSSDSEVTEAIREYELAILNPDDQDRMERAIQQMERLQAWDAENEFKMILSKLSLDDFELKTDHLSGGQIKRLALAQVLVQQPEMLILDEPTNHLDMEMIEWLENYLQKTSATVLMVTHDRYFLESVCGTIYELDDQTLYKYEGNYSYYLEKKEQRIEVQRANLARAKNLFTRELAWMRTTPQARTGKAKYRIDAFHELKKKAKQRISEDAVQLDMQMERLGTKVIELHKIKKAFGDLKIVDGFSYNFQRFDRVGIVGKNGVGKSTFLNMITGKEEADGGKIVIGDTIKFGYFGQKSLAFDSDKRVIEVVKDFGEYIPLTKGQKLSASQLLERFLFEADAQYTYVSKLSGGEKRRLQLLTVLIQNPNFLILDEPTNDLDLMTLNVLEEFLMDYPGCLVIVSHDRFLLDKLTDHIFVFEGDGRIKDFPGTYLEYKLKQSHVPVSKEKVKKEAPKSDQPKERRTFKEEREFRELTERIAWIEKRRKEITVEFEASGTDAETIQDLSAEMIQISEELEEKEMRWLELDELKEN